MTSIDDNNEVSSKSGLSTDKLCKICLIVLLGLNLTEGNIMLGMI